MDNNQIILRKLEERDTANIVRWRNSEAVRRNLFTQSLLTEEQHLRYFRNTVQTGRCRQYIIQVCGEKPLDVGTVFLKNVDPEQKQAEFGIFIGEPGARGKHLSLAATTAVLQIAFTELGLERVYLAVVGDNLPAVKTYLRAGFQEIGRELNVFPRERQFADIIHMDIARENWEREQHGENQSKPL